MQETLVGLVPLLHWGKMDQRSKVLFGACALQTSSIHCSTNEGATTSLLERRIVQGSALQH